LFDFLQSVSSENDGSRGIADIDENPIQSDLDEWPDELEQGVIAVRPLPDVEIARIQAKWTPQVRRGVSELEAVSYSRMMRYLCEAKLGTAEVTLNPEPSSPHLISTIPTGRSRQPWKNKKSRFRPCENLPEPPISQAHALPSLEGSQIRSGSYDVFFAGCHTFCQMLRR
jgi:hypothetical protein